MWFDARAHLAEVLRDHPDLDPRPSASPPPRVAVVATVAGGATLKTDKMKPAAVYLAAGGRPLPIHAPTCSICGTADWRVSVTEPDGSKAHVACLPAFRGRI